MHEMIFSKFNYFQNVSSRKSKEFKKLMLKFINKEKNTIIHQLQKMLTLNFRKKKF